LWQGGENSVVDKMGGGGTRLKLAWWGEKERQGDAPTGQREGTGSIKGGEASKRRAGQKQLRKLGGLPVK